MYSQSSKIDIQKIKKKLEDNFSNLKIINSAYNKRNIFKNNILANKKNKALSGKEIKSAVLLPLVFSSDKKSLNILLTLRSKNLNNHAGQISFPGGKLDQNDSGFSACALRETEEELGFKQDDISIIGELNFCITGSGYIIKPIVGLLISKKNLSINYKEVEKIFEVPLGFILDVRNHTTSNVKNKSNNECYTYYDMYWKNNRIWGATASILINFYEIIEGI